MSPSILDDSALTRWLAQLTAMREAIAELKATGVQQNGQIREYGCEITLEDGDEEDDSSNPDLSYDFWDSEDEQKHIELNGSSSFDERDFTFSNGINGSEYGLEWLVDKCAEFAKRHPGMIAVELQEQIIALLTSNSSGTEVLVCPRMT